MKHNGLRRFAASLIGIVFVVSGLLKMLDPVGTGLIVTEYLKFFHMGFATGIAKGLGIMLCLVETITGAALITGVFRKHTAIVASALTLFFTLVTLLLLVVNPTMDCGCFGEAIHLTHLQSFLKNIALLLFAALAFIPFRDYGETKNHKAVAFWIGTIVIILGSIYTSTHIPPVDFTAYAPGAKLYSALDNDFMASDGYYASYIYEKNGKRASFTLDALPDTTWTFVKVDTVYRNSAKAKKEASVLSFSDSEGNYHDALAASGKVIILSVYNPKSCNWDRVSQLFTRIADDGKALPIVLTTTIPEKADISGMNVFTADYKTLITLNRANGGATYLSDGEIVRKWRSRDFPGPDGLSRLLQADITDTQIKSVTPGRILAQGYALCLLALLVLL